MPSAIAFDTLAYARKLKSAGFTEKQAEIQAEALVEIVDERLASKQDILELKRDIKELETTLKRDMKELETTFKRDIKELEMRLTIRLGTMMAISIAVVATLVKLL